MTTSDEERDNDGSSAEGGSALNTRKLSGKQRAFVDAFTGEARGSVTKALRLAGYNAPQMGKKLLSDDRILAEIDRATEECRGTTVADRKELQGFFTGMMRSEKRAVKDRLKAAELLCKMQGYFIERVHHSGELGIANKVFYPDNGRGPAPPTPAALTSPEVIEGQVIEAMRAGAEEREDDEAEGEDE